MVKPEKFGYVHLVCQFTVRLSVYLHNLQGKICVMNLIYICTAWWLWIHMKLLECLLTFSVDILHINALHLYWALFTHCGDKLLFNSYIHIYFYLQYVRTTLHYKFSFLKIIWKSIFHQLLQGKAHLLFSTASTITHYPFLGDLHIPLFILHFFIHLTPYIYIYIYIYIHIYIYTRYQCFHSVNLTLHTVISIYSCQLKKKIQLETRKQDESCQKIQDPKEREGES